MNQNPFSVDRRLFERLLERSSAVSWGEGRSLFSRGDAPAGLYLVVSGGAALLMASTFDEATTCFYTGAGSVLGLPAVVADQPYSLTAMADKDSEIRFVARSDFEQLMQAEPNLNLLVLQVLAAELRSARQAVADLGGHSGDNQIHAAMASTI